MISAFIRNNSGTRENHTGSITIEFALLFPIFLVGILIIIFLGLGYHARSSLNAAVGSIRQAYTRAQVEVMGGDHIQTINDWYFRRSSTFPVLLYHNVALADARTHYRTMLEDEFGVVSVPQNFRTDFDSDGIPDVPLSFAYSQALVGQYMRKAIGPAVMYPCDAETTAGCLECRNLPPRLETAGVYFPRPPPPPLNDPDFPDSYVGIQCKYHLGNPITKTIDALVGVLTGRRQSSLFVFESKEEYLCFDSRVCG